MHISEFFKTAKPFTQLCGLLFFLLVGFAVAGGIQILVGPIGEGASSVRFDLVVQMGSQLLVFLVPSLAYAVCFQGSPMRYFMVDLRARRWMQGGVAMLLMILVLPLMDWITVWNGAWDFGPLESSLRAASEYAKGATERMLSLTDTTGLVLMLLSVALIPAICEELFFRGSIQQVLCSWIGNGHAAVVVTAVVFSLAHGDLYGFVPRLLLGLLLGYLFVYSKSILVNICAHFINNAIVVVLYWLYNNRLIAINPATPLSVDVCVTLSCLLAAGIIFYFYIVPTRGDGHRGI